MNSEQLMQMQHMLSGCLNPDNGIRTAAEKTITDHLNQHREVFIFGLIKLIRTSPEANVGNTQRTSTLACGALLHWAHSSAVESSCATAEVAALSH